ncbi:class I SAM-dependent methyltransferase [Phragmitibacter flavus]|uniref:Class I SAM-dependent methyltransferase n=1 Tax=Phragmitibacter flavus TaxID=2576071 RepID=A0A5R8KFI4_9BACT|nr:class I SAM-dependent methyltransferase [Phragmitibacter flavus]TLD71064.1 class I SAM-dependent methyltransferase [Phragmitibacter flavus]
MRLYDVIGKDYAKTRLADARIVGGLDEGLGLAHSSTILDVGAGTGKYSRALADLGFTVLALEPSEVMRGQSSLHPRVRMIAAAAEDIPLPSNSADGAIMVLALHHFSDRKKALAEILRVIGNGPLVIFSFQPQTLNRFWLADYFPTLGREGGSSFSHLEDVAEEVRLLTGRTVREIPFLLPRDLEDRFAAAGWAEPESYLSPAVRNGISSFALMDPKEVSDGIARLSADLESGTWDSRNGSLRLQDRFDAGYHFIIAEAVAENEETDR